jgi:hypothetical protein
LESAHSNQAYQKCQRFEGVTQLLRARGHKSKIAVHTWRHFPMTRRFAHRALWSNSNQKFFNYGKNVPPQRVRGRAIGMAHGV